MFINFPRYIQVTKRIGDGGFGAVFEVIKLANPKKRYALKVMKYMQLMVRRASENYLS